MCVQAVTWTGEELGANFDVTPLAESTDVDDELKASAAKYHEELVELAVEQDEDVMMEYLEVCLFDFVRCFVRVFLCTQQLNVYLYFLTRWAPYDRIPRSLVVCSFVC